MPTVLGPRFSRRERALRILRFRTGSGLSFDIMVDRAMDLNRILQI